MLSIKNYRFGFEPGGLILFILIMLPNCIWFAVPAGNDVLRQESATALLDTIASVLQVLLVAALCMLRNISKQDNKHRILGITVAIAVVLYYLGWGLYYCEIVTAATILDLCIAPCVAFILYALYKKNIVAFLSAIGFMVCHVLYGVINFV